MEKSLSAFPKWKQNGHVYYKAKCSACKSKAYRSRHPETVRAIQQRARAKYRRNQHRLKRALLDHIGQIACRICGIDDIRTLSFHHRNPAEKNFKLSWGFTHSLSLETLKAEAELCDVLCANCHNVHHYRGDACDRKEARARARRTAILKQQIMRAIGQGACKVCGYKQAPALSFHHCETSAKGFEMSEAINKNLPFATLVREARKCDVLCMNCHFIKHAEQ